MAVFNSNTSSSTTMTVTMEEVGRIAVRVTWRCHWSVTTGSQTYNNNDNRTLYIYDSLETSPLRH